MHTACRTVATLCYSSVCEACSPQGLIKTCSFKQFFLYVGFRLQCLALLNRRLRQICHAELRDAGRGVDSDSLLHGLLVSELKEHLAHHEQRRGQKRLRFDKGLRVDTGLIIELLDFAVF